MKLRHIFQSKEKAFNEAIVTDDVERMRKLFQKKDGFDFLIEIMKGKSLEHMSKAMAQLFINEVDDKVVQRWALQSGSKPLIMNLLVIHALRNKRLDLVDEFIASGMDFNRETGDAGVVHALIVSEISNAEKLPRLRQMLSKGHDKIAAPEGLMQVAVEKNFTEGVDFLAAIGIDPHKNNEQYLRAAAKAGAHEMAQHLISSQKADVELAIKTSRELGNRDEWLFLEGLRQEAPQAPDKPATIESLTAEVSELKSAMRELTQMVREMREPDKGPGKPVLKGPQG